MSTNQKRLDNIQHYNRITNLDLPISSKLAHENDLMHTSNFRQQQNLMSERSNFSEVFQQISDNNTNMLNRDSDQQPQSNNQFKFRASNNLTQPGSMTQRSDAVSSPTGYTSSKQD